MPIGAVVSHKDYFTGALFLMVRTKPLQNTLDLSTVPPLLEEHYPAG